MYIPGRNLYDTNHLFNKTLVTVKTFFFCFNVLQNNTNIEKETPTKTKASHEFY